MATFSPTADVPRRKPHELQHFGEPSDKLSFHIDLLNPVPHIVVARSSWLGFAKASATTAFLPTMPGLPNEKFLWIELHPNREIVVFSRKSLADKETAGVPCMNLDFQYVIDYHMIIRLGKWFFEISSFTYECN